MTSDDFDAKIDPLLQLLNRLRQERDRVPLSLLGLVPAPLRAAMDLIFGWVEEYDRQRGIELRSRTPTEGHDNSQNAEKGHNPQGQ